jgi:hypothetical protein
MKKIILFLLLILTVSFDSQNDDAYDAGEWFKFRIHYGFVMVTLLEVKDAVINNKSFSRYWYTTGMSRFSLK